MQEESQIQLGSDEEILAEGEKKSGNVYLFYVTVNCVFLF